MFRSIIWGVDFQSGHPYDAILARDHLEKLTVRYAQIMGDMDDSFSGASLAEAFLVIRNDAHYEDIQDVWKGLVNLTRWRGMLHSGEQRQRLINRFDVVCVYLKRRMEEHANAL